MDINNSCKVFRKQNYVNIIYLIPNGINFIKYSRLNKHEQCVFDTGTECPKLFEGHSLFKAK